MTTPKNPIFDLPENVRVAGSGYRTVRGALGNLGSERSTRVTVNAATGAAAGAFLAASIIGRAQAPESWEGSTGVTPRPPAVTKVVPTPWFPPREFMPYDPYPGIVPGDSPRGLGKNEFPAPRQKKSSGHITSSGTGTAHFDPVGTSRGSITTIGSSSPTSIIPPTMDEDSVTTPAQPTAEFGGFGGGGGGGVDRCASLLEAIKKMGLRAISNLPEDDSCLRQLYNQYGVNTKFALANAVSRTGGT